MEHKEWIQKNIEPILRNDLYFALQKINSYYSDLSSKEAQKFNQIFFGYFNLEDDINESDSIIELYHLFSRNIFFKKEEEYIDKEKDLKRKTIKKFINYFIPKYYQSSEINLYGNEYIIGEKLCGVFKTIQKNDYTYNVEDFEGTEFEKNSILYFISFFGFAEWGTSIRGGWIQDEIRDVFDLFIQLLEKDYYTINFTIEKEGMGDRYDLHNEDHIKYLMNVLDNESINDESI